MEVARWDKCGLVWGGRLRRCFEVIIDAQVLIYHSKFRISENIKVRTNTSEKLTAHGILGAVKFLGVDALNVPYIMPYIHIVHLFKKKVLSKKTHIKEKTETYINELKEMISDEESRVCKRC
jgi:hypothetical protein